MTTPLYMTAPLATHPYIAAPSPLLSEVSRIAADGEAPMAHVERLLGCPSCGSSSLRGVLLARGINVAGDALSIPRSPAAARARDVVAQCLYAALFTWLVQVYLLWLY